MGRVAGDKRDSAVGKDGHVGCCSATRRQNTKKESSPTPLRDLENSHTFSFRNDVPHGQFDPPSQKSAGSHI